MRYALSALLTAALMVFPAVFGSDLEAQTMGEPQHRQALFSIYAGGFTPTGDLGTTEFESSFTLGGTAGIWLNEYVGVRGNVLFAQTDPDGPPNLDVPLDNPNVWQYSGDLILRRPMRAEAIHWTPYLVGGFGAKTYDFEVADTETDFQGNFGAGLQFQLPQTQRWSLIFEVRDFVSSFEMGTTDDTQHDIVWTAGLGVGF